MLLSEYMRPNLESLDNLLGPARKIWDRDLKQWLTKNKFHFVLWGPPGSGKTTLIKLLCEANNQPFISLSAVRDGVKEIRDAVYKNPHSIIFIDEIHRLNTSQQDVLLPIMEQSEAWIIGATTESPRVSLNAPLLSRLRTIYISKLEQKDIILGLTKAISSLNSKNLVSFSEEKEKHFLENSIPRIAKLSGGDLRFSLNLFESISNCLTFEEEEEIYKNTLKSFSAKNHYDYISAMIKSMRGSDPDAALFYAITSLDSGEDPLFILRRCIIFASEDVSNADINALTLANQAYAAVQNVGMPEGVIPLAQCVTYLASTVKSNKSYKAISKVRAWKAIAQENGDSFEPPVPLTKRGASAYQYPHNFPNAFVNFQYLPESIQKIKKNENQNAYEPKDIGIESRLRARLKELWGKYK